MQTHISSKRGDKEVREYTSILNRFNSKLARAEEAYGITYTYNNFEWEISEDIAFDLVMSQRYVCFDNDNQREAKVSVILGLPVNYVQNQTDFIRMIEVDRDD